MSRRGRGGGHRDAKSISKNLARYDPDITSPYVDDEEDNVTFARNMAGARNNGGGILSRITGGVLHGNNRRGGRHDQQAMRSAAGNVKNVEMVHRIRVVRGQRYGVPWIMKQLHERLEDFKPLMIAPNQKGDIEFIVKSGDSAEACTAISKRILHQKTNDRVIIQQERIPAPWMKLKPEEVKVIHAVVDSRFNAESRALDLKDFYNDQKFKDANLFMTLTKNNVMLSVMERIDERYGRITALSLADNRLKYLEFAASLVYFAKFVKVLDLSNNQIDNINQLDRLRGMPVETLFFEGNPVCEKLTNATDYLSSIHQVFPRVKCLDGIAVQPSSVTDPDDESSKDIPPRPGFYGNDQCRVLVERFLVEYFKLYDGENGATTRKSLMQAYDADNSTLTLTLANLRDTEPIRYKDEAAGKYFKMSHNILASEKWERIRESRLFRGSMDIAVALSKLPITKHYTESFIVDVSMMDNAMMSFTVQGLFEDHEFAKQGQIPSLNFFSRTFVVSPRENDAIAVLADSLYVSAITADRMSRYKMMLNKANSNTPATAAISMTDASASASTSTPVAVTPDVQQQMIESFCRESGMKPEWSRKCLEDFSWDYSAAGQAFLANRASIPPDAFVNPQ